MPTKIEWVDESWNVVTGCTWQSEGCDHCYARRVARRLSTIPGSGYVAGGDGGFRPTFHDDRLDQPRRWRQPRRVLVCSMGDLFHPQISFLQRVLVWQAIMASGRHTFCVLTKRADTMAAEWPELEACARGLYRYDGPPTPNIWAGVSVEHQAAAELRVPDLLRTPAALRFVSCEPLLGPLDLTRWLWPAIDELWPAIDEDGICLRWVIAGCENGPQRRPADGKWFRSLKDQCYAAGVPYFLKQAEIAGRVTKFELQFGGGPLLSRFITRRIP